MLRSFVNEFSLSPTSPPPPQTANFVEACEKVLQYSLELDSDNDPLAINFLRTYLNKMKAQQAHKVIQTEITDMFCKKWHLV